MIDLAYPSRVLTVTQKSRWTKTPRNAHDSKNLGPSLAPAHSESGDPIMGLWQAFGVGSAASRPKSRGSISKHEFSGILSTWPGFSFPPKKIILRYPDRLAHGDVVDRCIRDPRTKTFHASWVFGKLAVQSS